MNMKNDDDNKILERHIDDTRRLVVQVDVLLVLLSLATGLFGGLLLAVLADHWLVSGGLGGWTRLGVFITLGGFVALVAYRRIVPLFLYPINPVYAAQLLERGSPTVKNAIINWILLRRERIERGASANPLAERMFDGLTRSAAGNADAIPAEHVVDTRGIVRWGTVLALMAFVLIGYTLLSPKNPLTSIERILMPWSDIAPPQAVRFQDIEPGNITALQGERLTVSAEVLGRIQDTVYLMFSTDDGQAVRQAIPMTQPEGKRRYEAPFPPGKQGFVSGVDYWIQCGDSRSGMQRIDVRPVASLEVASLAYRYPDYTGLAEETVEHGGDIRAVEGTEVVIVLRSSLPLQRADILLDDDPKQTLPMNIAPDKPTEATASLPLHLEPAVRNYSFRAVDRDGVESRRSGTFRVEVVPDKAPVVQWSDTDAKLKDLAQIELPLNASLDLTFQAEDPDFALRQLRFRGESGNKLIRPVELLENSPSTGPTSYVGSQQRTHVFSPLKCSLNEGDTVDIWAEAVDTKLPEANTASTRKITVKVIAPQRQEEPPKQEPEKNDPEKQDEPSKPDQAPKQDDMQDEAQGDESRVDDQGKESGDGQKDGDEKNSDPKENAGEPDKQESEDGKEQSGQKDGDKQDGKQEPDRGEPVDPETQDGDAMEKIMEQMKKEGKKLPENEKQRDDKENNQSKPDKKKNEDNQGGQEEKEPQKQPNNPQENKQKKDDCDSPGQGGMEGPGESGSKNEQSDEGQGGQGKESDNSGDSKKEQQGGESSKAGSEDQHGAGQDDQKKSDTEKQPGEKSQDEQSGGECDNPGEQGSGGDKKPSQGKKSGGTSGGDQKGDPASKPDHRKGDNRNSDKKDIPVDPNDGEARERDDLDPNTKDRRNQGGDASEPKRSDQKAKDNPHDTLTSGDEGKGRESTQSGRSDRAQSADEGKLGDEGSQVEQEGGSKGGDPADCDSPNKSGSGGSGQGEKSDDSKGPSQESKEGRPGEQGGPDSEKTAGGQDKRSQGKQSDGPGKNRNGDEMSDASDGTPQDGAVGGGDNGSSTPGIDTPTEEANLEYSKQATNLVLEYLEEQLKEKPNPELLEKLGWNEDQLRAFHKKWKRMAEESKQVELNAPENDAWKEALKSLGIKPSRERQDLRRSDGTFRDESSATESRRHAPPPAMKERFKRYNEGISR